MTTVAVLLAGGAGTRIQQEINKVYLSLGDRQIISYALESLDLAPRVELIVVVHRGEDGAHLDDLLASTPTTTPVETVLGGDTRHLSEYAALEHLASRIDDIDLIAIHDAARPFATIDLISGLLEKADETGGAIPALPPGHPIIQKDGHSLSGGDLVRVQTPQVFSATPLLAAYRAATADGFGGVDTAETVENYSDLPVDVVRGDPDNIKITFIEDIFEAEVLATSWESGRWV